MPLLGAHQSIAGGYYRAVDEAARLKMDCVQIFTKNNNQWGAKPLNDDDIGRFGEAIVRTGIKKPCGHTSYLINLASPQDDLWQKSVDSFVEELQRAEALGLVGLVVHPGACTSSTEAEGVTQVIRALDIAIDRSGTSAVEVWLEITAGQGSCLGHRFEHIRDILAGAECESRLAVCVDTCHVFAAGYPFRTQDEQRRTLQSFDRVVGLGRIRAFHLNDSKRELGSRVDRHQHIGKGKLGLDAFRQLLNNKRFASLPMYMETPKGETNGKSWDAANLARLRRLLPKKPGAKPLAPARRTS